MTDLLSVDEVEPETASGGVAVTMGSLLGRKSMAEVKTISGPRSHPSLAAPPVAGQAPPANFSLSDDEDDGDDPVVASGGYRFNKTVGASHLSSPPSLITPPPPHPGL